MDFVWIFRAIQKTRLVFSLERLTVGALVHSGICLVSTHEYAVEGTVIFVAAVMCALLNRAFD